ncbi:MAG: SMEK domain-containing protein [Gammaproteobacteria bacterium]|nr:SMEK domain-containing protein [Gammaproteobacteria bacterium]MYG97017.1 SMEK domain-containing protein [Gammaproteobacteria bacterium]
MKHLRLTSQFSEDLAKLSREVETSVAMGHLDINKVCEDIFCGLFRELYGLKNIRNLNEEEKQNFPGIDLDDQEERVAIQVTSDKSLEKIKNSLSTIISHRLHEKYDRIIIYILTRKQGSYSVESINKVCDGKIEFDVSSDILDYRDLAARGANAPPRILKRALDILGAYMRGCDIGLADQDFDPPDEPPETLSANLLEFYFPQTLYIAELLPEVLEEMKSRHQRTALGNFVRRQQLSVPSDYVVNADRLVTFHNLENRDGPFAFLVDEGTVETFQPSEYYDIDEDYERVFKSLLRLSLQQKLYRHRVLWKHIEKQFIFLPTHDTNNTRTITWSGQKIATRSVFERKYKNNDPDKVLSTRHFSFSVSFVRIKNDWYLSITPDWFFSHGDQYRQSLYGDKLISGKKKQEKNRSVFDHFRFLCSWLSDLDSEDLFSEDVMSSPQVTFGQILTFGSGRYLNESLWEPLGVLEKDDSEQRKLDIR